MRARTLSVSLATCTVAGLLATPGAAFAATPTPSGGLAVVKARAVATIDLRLQVLRADASAIARAKHLSAADRTSLGGVISQDVTGLTAQRATILTDTTRAAVVADTKVVYTGYRVFLLLQPQIRDVITADAVAAGAQQVTAAASALQGKLSGAGTLTSEETTLLTTTTTDAAAATAAVNGEVAAVLAVTPSIVSKTLRPAALTTARTDDHTARVQLAAARAALAGARALAHAAPTPTV